MDGHESPQWAFLGLLVVAATWALWFTALVLWID